MSQWALTSLAADSWSPTGYLPIPTVVAAPVNYAGGTSRLAEVVDFISARSSNERGEAVVTPGGVSLVTGAVRASNEVASGVVYRLGHELAPGDVLVPVVGDGPCVFVTPEHRNLAFTRGFAALRAKRGFEGQTLWALLSSASGVRARKQFAVSSSIPRLIARDLADLLVPLSISAPPKVADLLPVPAVEPIASVAVVSQWREVLLKDEDNWSPRRLLDPLRHSGDVTIGEIGRVRMGRLDPRAFRPEPFARAVPALRASEVGRLSTPRSWTLAGEEDKTGPHTLLVGATAGRIAIPPMQIALAREILALDVEPRGTLSAIDVRARLLGYLASAAGQERLSANMMGTAVRRLSAKDFRTMRVPDPRELPAESPLETELLVSRLERALWS